MSDQLVAATPQSVPANASAPATDSAAATSAQEKDQAMYDAFTLGWDIVELKSRVQIALVEPIDSSLRLASLWGARFNRIAALHSKAFPNKGTAQTLFEPPSQDKLPYLYPSPETDYANKGISGLDTKAMAAIDNFKLYEVTRRAINCLILLHIKEDESLIPDAIKQFQDLLVKAVLAAPPNPSGQIAGPTGVTPEPENDLQKAKKALTDQTVKLLDAWNGYLLENYYVGGVIPNDDLELIAYEAGHSLSSLSWSISTATVPLEQATGADNSQKFIEAWQTVFRDQAVIRLQHQITELSAALDDAYYRRPSGLKRPDANAMLAAPNPDLPSQAILAVKRSIDYWQRAAFWIPDKLEELRSSGDTAHSAPASWSRPMRLALTEQANIWQTLMTGQQSLRAYNMESVTYKIMQDVMGEIQASMQTDFSAGVKKTEQAMKDLADEAKKAITDVGNIAKNGLDVLFRSFVGFFWPIVGVIALIFIVLVVVALAAPQINSTAAAASGGVGVTGFISAVLGYFGLGKLQEQKTQQQTQVDTKATASAAGIAPAKVEDGSLLTRIEGAVQEVGTEVLKALERGYEQMRIELDGLQRSVAVAYPLVEYFELHFKLESDVAFLTDVIWNKTEREQEVKQALRAAFGPLATFIGPSTSSSTGDDKKSSSSATTKPT